MTGLGALLGPTTPVVAPARRPVVTVRGEPMDTTAALLLRVLPMGQLGWPALSVPTGSTDGLPFGVQVVGRPYQAEIVRIAAVIERSLP